MIVGSKKPRRRRVPVFLRAVPWVLVPAAPLLATGENAASGTTLDTMLGNETLALFLILTLGLLLGRIKFTGLSLGSSGVLFTALGVGHLGYSIPGGVGNVGLVLFVYCVGITAGPGFFRAFVRRGRTLAKLGVALVVFGAVATWLVAGILKIPHDLALGLFAGAMTSTPGLAAGMEALSGSGDPSQVAVGYGIAYPFGVVAVVLFVQLLPRLLGHNLNAADGEMARRRSARKIVRELVEICNPAIFGKKVHELDDVAESNCQISRILRDGELVPLPAGFELGAGQHVLVVGKKRHLDRIVDLLGRQSDVTGYVMDTERQRSHVVVSSRNVAGRSLGELKPLNVFGVTVSRITRHDIVFVPTSRDTIEYGDMLHVVGERLSIARFSAFAGHRERTFDETDVISLCAGIVAGVLLGSVSFSLGGGSFSLGMAGGPLFVALIMGHCGQLGPVVGHLPRASRLLLMEIGLILFLASAGVQAGGGLVPVIREHGLSLCGAAVFVATLPIAIGYLLGRNLLKLDFIEVLGGVCGGMTSTPGLAVITSKTDADTPIVSYAAAYPVALILMTVFARLLFSVLS